MPEFTTTGYVRSGHLEVRRLKDMKAAISRMRDGEVFISIVSKRAARSNQQNRWYWGVIVELLSEHTGYTPDEIHEVLKAKFIPKRLAVSDSNGEIKGEFVIGGTTTTLDKNDFGEFCESVRRWAADDLGVVIPDPDTGVLWTGALPQHAHA